MPLPLAMYLDALIAAGFGALLWTVAEYFLHRFAGHTRRPNRRFAREHQAHHRDPRYFAPTALKVALSVPTVSALALLLSQVVGWSVALGLAGGFLTAYVGYEILHRRIHTHPPRGPLGRALRRHHLAHHFASPATNHGVTTQLWDRVFGTFAPRRPVRIPPKLAMDWLVDPTTGRVKDALACDYELTRPKPTRDLPSA